MDKHTRQLALRAYERGRWSRASVFFPAAFSLGIIVYLVDGALLPLFLAAVVGAVGVAILGRGAVFGQRGVTRGVWLGLLLGVLPLAARLLPHGCVGGSCSVACAPICFVGGALAAFLLARTGRGGWLAFVLVASGTASISCVVFGVAGAVGMLGGVAVVAPLAWRLQRS